MGLFILGTLWFWVGLIVASGLIIYFLESALWENNSTSGGGLKATAVVIGFIVLYYFIGSKEHVISSLAYITNHTWTIVVAFFIYLCFGVAWAFAKWYFFLLSKRDILDYELEKGYIVDNVNHYIPTAGNNKARIISWMTYWPFSGLWTLINDPVRRAFQYVFRNFESTFDNISRSMFSNQRILIEKRFAEKKAKEAARNERVDSSRK